MYARNLSGQKFGRLTVVKRGSRQAMHAYWLCVCACGRRKQIRDDILVNGTVRSCGCLRREMRRVVPLRHGHCRKRRSTPEYITFHFHRNACRNPNSRHARHYHDKGIEFHFESFEAFLAVVGLRPGPDYWLMRIDHDKNVEPGNLMWKPIKHHRRKKRRARRS